MVTVKQGYFLQSGDFKTRDGQIIPKDSNALELSKSIREELMRADSFFIDESYTDRSQTPDKISAEIVSRWMDDRCGITSSYGFEQRLEKYLEGIFQFSMLDEDLLDLSSDSETQNFVSLRNVFKDFVLNRYLWRTYLGHSGYYLQPKLLDLNQSASFNIRALRRLLKF
jgi:hypothetical protein